MITPLHPNLQKVSTEKLSAAFQKTLHENWWELYESDKQAQPEPVKEYDEAAFLKRFETNLKRDREEFFRVTEPTDPHAALRAEYTKQLVEGTTGFYLWEVLEGDTWEKRHNINNFYSNLQYRCTDTDISCYVSKDGEPAIRMLRTDAQELQRKLGNTVEWSWKANGIGDIVYAVDNFDFIGGTYTYRTKATIKLDGKMVTPEQHFVWLCETTETQLGYPVPSYIAEYATDSGYALTTDPYKALRLADKRLCQMIAVNAYSRNGFFVKPVEHGFSLPETVTIKLDGNRVTPEHAAAEWEAKKETHDVWYTRYGQGWLAGDIERFDAHSKAHRPEYELRPKHPAWTGSRDDVLALLKEEGLL